MRVEWDPTKAKSNLIKHGISFFDAGSILDIRGTIRPDWT
jgi:uncharacterized DUF497 family protein